MHGTFVWQVIVQATNLQTPRTCRKGQTIAGRAEGKDDEMEHEHTAG